MDRFVVCLEIAGTAHLALASRDAATALEAAYGVLRQPDLDDWWPRRQAADFIAPHASAVRGARRVFQVTLPVVGTAYVTVEAADKAAAVEAAYRQIRRDHIEAWRAIRAPVEHHAPSVARQSDTIE